MRQKALKRFSKKVLESQQDIDSNFVEVVNNNFWDLIDR